MAQATQCRRRCCPRRSSIVTWSLNSRRQKPALRMRLLRKGRRSHCLTVISTVSTSLPHPRMEIKTPHSMSATRKSIWTIQDWTGFVGQWDTRLWKNQTERDWAISANHAVWPPADLEAREKRPVSPRYPEDYVGLRPGYVKPASLAWYASHQHTADGLNQPYRYSYLFAYALNAPGSAKTLKLPNNDKIRILAISTADENPMLEATQSLYTTLNGREPPSESEAAMH